MSAGYVGPVDPHFRHFVAEPFGQYQELQIEQIPALATDRKQLAADLAAEHLEAALRIANRNPQPPPGAACEQPADQPAKPGPPPSHVRRRNQPGTDRQIGPGSNRPGKPGLLLDGSGPVGVGKQQQPATRRQHPGLHRRPLAPVLGMPHRHQFGPILRGAVQDFRRVVAAAIVDNDHLVAARVTPVQILPNRRQIGRQPLGLVVRRNDHRQCYLHSPDIRKLLPQHCLQMDDTSPNQEWKRHHRRSERANFSVGRRSVILRELRNCPVSTPSYGCEG